MSVQILFLSSNAGARAAASRGHARDLPGYDEEPWPDGGLLDLDREYNALQEALGFPGLGGPNVLQALPDMRWLQLPRVLSQTPSRLVLHFSGHGRRDGALYVRDDAGEYKPIACQQLAGVLRPFTQRVPLVVLNACHSDELAQALVQDIDIVIGMKRSVSDRAAICFSTTFYRMLVFDGRSVAEAFEVAVQSVSGEFPRDAQVARMRERDGVSASACRLFQPTRDAARQDDEAFYAQLSTLPLRLQEDLQAMQQQPFGDPSPEVCQRMRGRPDGFQEILMLLAGAVRGDRLTLVMSVMNDIWQSSQRLDMLRETADAARRRYVAAARELPAARL